MRYWLYRSHDNDPRKKPANVTLLAYCGNNIAVGDILFNLGTLERLKTFVWDNHKEDWLSDDDIAFCYLMALDEEAAAEKEKEPVLWIREGF